MKSVQQIRREYAALKRASRNLASIVDQFIVEMDDAMKMPEGRARGVRIGQALNVLELTLHGQQHFGLGMSFDAMKRQRARKSPTHRAGGAQ